MTMSKPFPSPFDGFRLLGRRNAAAPPPSLSAQVEAILSGTTGYALDPTDLATLWQDSAKTTPVTTAGQPVGAIRTKWGNTQFDFLQSTAGARPTWDGTRFLVPDGVDDFLTADGSFNVLRNAPGYYVAIRKGGTQNTQNFFCISTATNTIPRLALQGATTNRLRTQVRRLDADATVDTFGTLAVMDGNTYAFEADLAGTGNTKRYKDNSLIETIAHGGTPANSSDTASARMRLCANLSAGFFNTVYIGRLVLLPFIPTSGQRATIHDWLMEV